ncbi:MAG TPA: FISUMP domain-containing protein, partial [Chitinophagaceae bacterium]|nr:FISUMP domain-containing protein [Chitinophagaceae bacterium]
MKGIVSTLSLFLLCTYFATAQCNTSNTPHLGADTTLITVCYHDSINLSGIYNTTGFTTQFDIPNPASAKIGYHYLIATASSGCKDTAYITIKQDVKKWLGAVSSDWHDPANWASNEVPNEKTHVIVTGEFGFPCVVSSDDAIAASIRVLIGGSFEVTNNRKQDLKSNCDLLPPYVETGNKTVIIDNETSQIIQLVDSSKVVFNGNTTQLLSLDTSKIIVAQIAPNAPFGFLRKIRSIQHVGNVYTIMTDSTSLERAFKELYFEFSKTYGINDSAQNRLSSGERITDGNLSFNISVDHDFGGVVVASGSVNINPDFNMKVDIKNSHLNYAKIQGSFNWVAAIGMQVGVSNSFSNSSPIFQRFLPLIDMFPIIIQPVFLVDLGTDGAASIGFNASAQNTGFVSTFLEYSNGNWHTGYNKGMENTYEFSGINGEVNAELYVKPHVDFRLYGLRSAEATVSAKLYLSGEGSLVPKPACKFSVGISGGASAELKIFGLNFSAEYHPSLFNYEKTLYECYKPKLTTTLQTGNCYNMTTGGNITDSGSSRLQKRGLCWSTNAIPTLNDFKKEQIISSNDPLRGMGAFTDTINDLEPGTTYYMRSYAINMTDTGYGEPSSFVAQDSVFIDPRDGQCYTFRHIGTQVWMLKNMNISINNSCCYDRSDDNCAVYGQLYTWQDAMAAPPPGWRLPSESDWHKLIKYIDGYADTTHGCQWNSGWGGGALKEPGTTHWRFPNIGAFDLLRFKGLPAGSRIFQGLGYEDMEVYSELGYGTVFWSSTFSYGVAYGSILYHSDAIMRICSFEKTNWYSVRCI